jgi:NAD(P)H-hydrate epimerase
VIPVVTPEEMSAIDAEAPESTDVLIRRAAWAVAREAIAMMGGTYGRRVTVLAGKGNNGNDGRVAAALLERRGVRTQVVDVADAPRYGAGFPASDLLVDAAFGTGFSGSWDPPHPGSSPVLAVDIPSGIDGLSGEACGSPWHAVRTVTFAAVKPGLLQGDGPRYAGVVVPVDIGLDVSRSRTHLVEDADVSAWIPERDAADHKWKRAVWVVAGSPGMEGAGWLCARAAMRGGAGYVRASSPGVDRPDSPREVVGTALAGTGWGDEVAANASRFGAVVAGPGLGRSTTLRDELQRLCEIGIPVVLDADALGAVGSEPLCGARGVSDVSLVLTPHDGEYEELMGRAPGPDRLAAARTAAERHGAVVLLKGPTTVVAEPGGEALVVHSGDARLATAGTGDVLSGLIGAHLAAGVDPLYAAGAAAHLHGRAAELAGESGVVAGDVAEALGAARALL